MKSACLAAVVASSALLVIPAFAAKKSRPPAPQHHNFVALDLSAPAPAPLWRVQWAMAQLVDADSIKRQGDDITFDMLEIGQNFQGSIDPETKKPVYRRWWPTRLEHFRGSCGWRTLKLERFEVDGDATNMSGWYIELTTLVISESPFRTIFARLCGGKSLEAGAGAPSISAAVAMWKDMFAAPGKFLFVVAQPPSPQPPPHWLAQSHRFSEVARDQVSGNALFLDRMGLVRTGDSVTGVAFMMLGPAARVKDATAIAAGVARQTLYDCAARTMTVLTLSYWNARGERVREEPGANEIRAATDSPLTAKEIAAACEGQAADGPIFTSVEDIWGHGDAAP